MRQPEVAHLGTRAPRGHTIVLRCWSNIVQDASQAAVGAGQADSSASPSLQHLASPSSYLDGEAPPVVPALLEQHVGRLEVPVHHARLTCISWQGWVRGAKQQAWVRRDVRYAGAEGVQVSLLVATGTST